MPIAIYTDFGWNGPYIGQMKAVINKELPGEQILDLMHDAPRFQPVHSGILLERLTTCFPQGTVFVCIVDPGVGTRSRLPVIIKADQFWFVGPHNGLFDEVIRRSKHVLCREITCQPENMSDSFHGRDLFAPAAVMVSQGKLPDTKEIDSKPVIDTSSAAYQQVIYIDYYGNAMTGLRAEDIQKEQQIMVNNQLFSYTRTFAEARHGECFWYVNSLGLVELAINCGSVANRYGIRIGTAAVINE